MTRQMLATERWAYARMGPVRRVLHRIIRRATEPRFMWRWWGLYRRTWPK